MLAEAFLRGAGYGVSEIYGFQVFWGDQIKSNPPTGHVLGFTCEYENKYFKSIHNIFPRSILYSRIRFKVNIIVNSGNLTVKKSQFKFEPLPL